MDSTAEICIFCNNPADSKEDLFPRWILKRVRTGVPLYRQTGDAPPELTEDQEVRIPCVCQSCNNGWMSRMERTVQKFTGPMIDDFYLPNTSSDVTSQAVWKGNGTPACCNNRPNFAGPRVHFARPCATKPMPITSRKGNSVQREGSQRNSRGISAPWEIPSIRHSSSGAASGHYFSGESRHLNSLCVLVPQFGRSGGTSPVYVR
jgi:hypothetical protein